MWETRHPPRKLTPLTDWRSANKTRHSTTTHFKTKLANQRCDYSTLDFAGGQYFLNVAFKIPPKRTRRPPARSLNTIVHQMDHTSSRKTYDLVRKHQKNNEPNFYYTDFPYKAARRNARSGEIKQKTIFVWVFQSWLSLAHAFRLTIFLVCFT